VKYLFIALPLLCILASCASPDNTERPAPTAPAKPSPTAVTFHKVGETVKAEPWEVTLKSATIIDPAKYSQSAEMFPDLKDGDRFLVLDEHVKNISSEVQNIAGMQFVLQDKQGNSNFVKQLGIPDVPGPALGGDVSPSMDLSGQEAYVIPSNVHLLYWIYNPLSNTDGKAIQEIWEINI